MYTLIRCCIVPRSQNWDARVTKILSKLRPKKKITVFFQYFSGLVGRQIRKYENHSKYPKNRRKLEFVFYVKTDVCPPCWSDAVLCTESQVLVRQRGINSGSK